MSGLALKKALYEKLSADLVGVTVTDFVPSGTTGTYVVINDIPLDVWDDKENTGFEANPVIHVWSDVDCGLDVVQQTQADIYTSLHRQPLTIDGFEWVDSNQTFMEVLRDPSDGISYHGVSRINILFHKLL